MWSLHRGGLWKVVIHQRFYPNLHVHQDLTVSVFHFHCFQLPCTTLPSLYDAEDEELIIIKGTGKKAKPVKTRSTHS